MCSNFSNLGSFPASSSGTVPCFLRILIYGYFLFHLRIAEIKNSANCFEQVFRRQGQSLADFSGMLIGDIHKLRKLTGFEIVRLQSR